MTENLLYTLLCLSLLVIVIAENADSVVKIIKAIRGEKDEQ